MSDSDSDSDWENLRYLKYKRGETFTTYRISEDSLDRWSSIPVKTKREAAQRMKLCVFWLPTLLQPEDSNTCDWALEVGLISSKNSEVLTLEQLSKIEIVENILHHLEMGTLEKEPSRHVFALSNMLHLQCSPETLEKAVRFLEKIGDLNMRSNLQSLGHFLICFTTLDFIFSEYAKFIREMGKNMEKTMRALNAQPEDYLTEKSEVMKRIGNEKFQKQQYDEAVKYYSKAIKSFPDNHILYGNRALCYIRCKQYLKAAGDGKRAILIQPLWAKGHYRYCEALFCMDQIQLAFEANCTAKLLCRDDQEGLRELDQQFQKFMSEHKFTEHPKASQSFKVGLVTRGPQTTKTSGKSNLAKGPSAKVSEKKMNKRTGANEVSTLPENKAKDPKTSKSEKVETNSSAKKKPKNDDQIREVKQNVAVSKAEVCKELRFLVQDAHTALYDLRSRNAEQAFSQALSLLETVTPKELGLSTLDVLLLLFGRTSALTEIGQPEELAEAQKLLERMKLYEERTFQCLVFYAVGRVFLRENRFAIALQQFLDSLQMVKNQITSGKLTWPLTKEIVKETQPDYFKEVLESSIELCRFPPTPDAVCCLEKCLCPLKAEIYLTDPDFKGYVEMCCCQSCRVEFHINCWKSLKMTKFFEKNEKDILHEKCLTPDCIGQICSIRIFCPTGLVKCKFETAITKAQMPKKPKENQKCTSVKKLKSKEEHKLKRKQFKRSFQEKTTNDEILQQKDNSGTQSQQNTWLLYRDRVLMQISQNMDLLREEKGLLISTLTESLRPWLELDLSRGNQIAGRLLNQNQHSVETLRQAVELLLERKNRVWARVFIHQLSSCVDINPKLSSWACQLNDAGLNAAQGFIEQHAEHLEQLDLTLLLDFEPLKDMILEKLSVRPEFFSSTGLTVTDYLKQAPLHDMRLFIWTLEEHKDSYASCHTILDEYFYTMDGHCSVLRKSDENDDNSMRAKSRGRKKKGRERGVNTFSGMRGPTPREEWDQDFFEDDSLSFLHPADPFSVPSHLQEEVADFENQYNTTRTRSHYKSFLDNNPDPTKESLYDYFAQILEEHGPLTAEDHLLVGELENFPAMAKQKIEEAGSFEAFLLESLRFIKIGRRIGLAKHALSLQQAEDGMSLDDLDEISSSPDLYMADDFTSYLEDYSSVPTEPHPILPNPYLFYPQLSGNNSPSHWTDGNFDQVYNFLPLVEPELDVLNTNLSASRTDSTSEKMAFIPPDEHLFKRHAAVQTCQEAVRSVAVNTELYTRFESCQGDINKKEKSNIKLEQQIKKMTNCVKVNPNKDDAVLVEEIKTITSHIQVTHKELVMFQQKLEEEVKNYQKEKKANQEELKALKMETEQLVEEQKSLSQNIRERKISYEAKLNDFLELSNQSAAEKMSLEDEIKRCKSLLASSSRRAHTAQLSMVESRRDQGLYGLYRELADSKALLVKLDEAFHRTQKQELEITWKSCRAKVEELEKNISITERQFQEQLDQVKNGRKVCELLSVCEGNGSEAAAAPFSMTAKEFVPQASDQASRSASPPAAEASAAEASAPSPVKKHKAANRKPEPPHTIFDRTMETLTAMFPDYTRPDLMKYIQEFRSSRAGSLYFVTLQDCVAGVTQLILDHQEKLNSARANIKGRSSPSQRVTPFSVTQTPVWKPVEPQRARNSNALNKEDPCIICHEDMSPNDTCVLECRHGFHDECIRSWLKEQSTCPTCRNHAVLTDDFPALSGRRRQAP